MARTARYACLPQLSNRNKGPASMTKFRAETLSTKLLDCTS